MGGGGGGGVIGNVHLAKREVLDSKIAVFQNEWRNCDWIRIDQVLTTPVLTVCDFEVAIG